jgi:thioredoxin 1
MLRRSFLTFTAALALFPAALPAGTMNYSEGMIEEALARGEVVFLDYKASWCSTCKAQGRVIEALKAANPAYEAKVTFINVDWDTWKNAPVTTSRNIPRRSTLLVLQGEAELGRIVAGTGQAEIKALMDLALAAAQ